MGFSLRDGTAKREQPAAERQMQITAQTEQQTRATPQQRANHKPHHQNKQQYKLPARSNHTENSIRMHLSNQPTRTSRMRDRTATHRKIKRKRISPLLSDRNKPQSTAKMQQSILLSSANDFLFFLRAGCNHSQPASTTQTSSCNRKRRMCCCGVEPQTAPHPTVKEEENHPTVAGQLQILSHTRWHKN